MKKEKKEFKKRKTLKVFFTIFFLTTIFLTFYYISTTVFTWVNPTQNPLGGNVDVIAECTSLGDFFCDCFPYAHECSNVPIGTECGGGKVAYHNGAGSGLIAHSTDNSTGIQWGCRGQSVGTTSTAIGTGLANTNTIVNFHNNTSNFNSEDYYTFSGDYSTIGCHVDNNGTVAAKLCADLTTGGYEDWFLPSKEELTLLFGSKDLVGGYTSLEDEEYWSSSQYTEWSAWPLDFFYGALWSSIKSWPSRVRCIRAF